MKKNWFLGFSLGLLVVLVTCGVAGCDGLRGDRSAIEDSTESNRDTLQSVWRYEYEPVEVSPQTPPEVVDIDGDSTVIFAGQARLNALDTNNGDVKWFSELDPKMELYCDGLTFGSNATFCSHRFKALSWSLQDGKQRWEFKPPNGSISGKEFYDLGYYDLSPDYFWGSGRDGRVFGIDRETGRLVHEWKYDSRTTGIAFQDGALYLGRYRDSEQGQGFGSLAKVDASSGGSLWVFEPEYGAFITMCPMLHDGRVYAGTAAYSEKGVFVALDQETGEVIWRNRNARVYWAIWAETPNGSRIFVNNGRELIALNPEGGDTLWRSDMPGHGEAGLAYLNGYVYHPHGKGLRVVDAETGEIVHVEWPRDGYFWEVGTGAGKVFAQDSGALYAFEPYSPE